MRVLNQNEMNQVTGAGYTEDVCALASTITVADFLGRAAVKGAILVASKVLPSFVPGGAVCQAIAAVSYVSPALSLANTIFRVNPSRWDALQDKFHDYFG